MSTYCIIDEPKGLKAIEIKAGATISSDYFKQLLYWNKISGTTPSANYIIYGGSDYQQRSQATVLGWSLSGNIVADSMAD